MNIKKVQIIIIALSVLFFSCSDNDNPSKPSKIIDGMVLIPAGSFMMGNTGDYVGHDDEKPTRFVTISRAFFMSKYEVTQKQYEAVMGTNPSFLIGENHPVEQVSWHDAVVFCNTLSEIEGLTPCYTINYDNVTCNFEAKGYRLPTEAEWEYACKAGSTTDFYRGDLKNQGSNYLVNKVLDRIGWYKDNSGNQTQAVGRKEANHFGLYDMSGNVCEWCWDWYSSKYYEDGQSKDPKGPINGSHRVYRGGSRSNNVEFCRSASRFYFDSEPRLMGFRVVRTK